MSAPAFDGDGAPAQTDAQDDLATLKAALMQAVPRLRAFAMSLCGRTDQADDLVQETLMKGWSKLDSLQPDTNMMAWLYTILRNEFYSRLRRGRREVDDPDGTHAAGLVSYPSQEVNLHFQEFRAALFALPPDQREALVLVGASGLSYEEAAALCGCAVGTIKSRVNRGRRRLEQVLATQGGEGFGQDSAWRGIAGAPGV
jgi:RNA polymerase sigma-70 factor (ECF subfamily)